MDTLILEVKKQQLAEIEKEFSDMQKEYIQAEVELQSAQDTFDEISHDYEEVKDRRNRLKDEILAIEHKTVEDEQILPLDEFTKLFAKVSRFCSFDEDRLILQHVNVKTDSLQACNGFIAVEIKCDFIPEAIKGMLIHWDVRSDWGNNISIIADEYINLDGYFRKWQDELKLLYWKSGEDLKELILNSRISTEKDSFIFKLGDIDIGVSKSFATTVLSLFDDKELVLIHMADSSLSPLYFTTENIKAVLMPVKIEGR